MSVKFVNSSIRMIAGKSMSFGHRTTPGRRIMKGLSASPRALSSISESYACKLHNTFETYRQENYSRELKSRFQKDMKDAIDSDNDGLFTVEEILKVLTNIGARDCLSSEQLRQMFGEISPFEEAERIPVATLNNML
eukprot:CAMPEP_0194275210 /NCGR_PEP_ID=MMETSP0169-20130528/8110_1 /TAXON_ID=218684 /ORGANISM="Corethron pennatum, Strain L29A3" /LENGTH=136 /DNA_ID=CAMNT_0039018621 /DNA_START=133 /DNA_END=543 /DNA_ORIENTATION=+